MLMSVSLNCRLLGLLLLFAVFSLKDAAAKAEFPEIFPIPMTFRAFDGLNPGTELYNKRFDEQEPYLLIHGPGGPRAAQKARMLHARWPEKLITIQASYGGISEKDFGKVWPGHWLYKPGSVLARNVSLDDGIIFVREPNRIAENHKEIKRTSKEFPFGLTIYALDASGAPDWSHVEHVILETMDGQALRVRRGQWGTKPLSFEAGKAVVVGHMKFWTQQWQLNFSLHSPRGGRGNLTAAEWFAREMTQTVVESQADGIEFDVARWTWGFPAANPMDANNDLVPDYGYLDGVNSFGLGGRIFFRELRQMLGATKIIQADSNDAMIGVRGWKYLNGVQLESFPAANDFDRFSEVFLHLRLWAENAEAMPRISYPFTKTPTSVFANAYLPDGRRTDFRFRVGLAAACLVGMPHPFASLDEDDFDPANPRLAGQRRKQEFGVFVWDEYRGGDKNEWGWLGAPLGKAQQDMSDMTSTDLLAGIEWHWTNDSGFVAIQNQTLNSFTATVKRIPSGILPDKMWFGVRLGPKGAGLRTLMPGRDYTLEFEARGDDSWQYAGQTFDHVPRMITIGGAVASKEHKPLSVLVDSAWRTYRVSFVADESHTPTPIFGVAEQTGTTELRNVRLFLGGSERWSREFENGLVLLNMTSNPWKVAVRKGYYQRLKGAQDPDINTGKFINHDVVIPPRDALFLIKR